MPERRVREVSRRVVSERVLGSANPVAKWGRDSKAPPAWTPSAASSSAASVLRHLRPALLRGDDGEGQQGHRQADRHRRRRPRRTERQGAGHRHLTTDALIIPPKGAPGRCWPTTTWSKTTKRIPRRARRRTRRSRTARKSRSRRKSPRCLGLGRQDRRDEVGAAETRRHRNRSPPRQHRNLPWEETWSYTDPQGTHRERLEVMRPGLDVLLAAQLQNGQVAAQPDFYIVTTHSKDELVASHGRAEEGQRWLLIIASDRAVDDRLQPDDRAGDDPAQHPAGQGHRRRRARRVHFFALSAPAS